MQQQQQQQSQLSPLASTAASLGVAESQNSGVEATTATAAAAVSPRWLSSSATWRPQASPPQWLSAAAFKEAAPPPMLTSGSVATAAEIGRPATAGPAKAAGHAQQQRPLGIVRAVSSHGAARRRARGTRTVGLHHRSPTPEPPAGQGGYLMPSRGGRVTPQMAVAAVAASSEAALVNEPQQPAIDSCAVGATPSHTTVVVRARSGRRYRAATFSASALPSSKEADDRLSTAGAPATTTVNGSSGGSYKSTATGPLESAQTPANGNGTAADHLHQQPHAAAAAAASPAASPADALLGPLRVSTTPVRSSSAFSGGGLPLIAAANGGGGNSSSGGSGGVTSFSYMHFLNRPPDLQQQQQQQPLVQASIRQSSPRPRLLASYAESPGTKVLAAAQPTSVTTGGGIGVSSDQDAGPAKPLFSVTDGAGCTTEIFPIKSILKKHNGSGGGDNGKSGGGGGGGGHPVLLSASARPQTAGGALKLLTSAIPPQTQLQLQLQSLAPSSSSQIASAAATNDTSPASVVSPTSAASDASAASAAPAVVATSARRPVRRTASMQNGQLSLRARSQSAGPKRGVRFDMTSNSVHEYEPVPQMQQQPPPFTADTEHWYRLMWKRLAEQ